MTYPSNTITRRRFVGGCAAWRQGGDTLRQEYPELAEEFAAKHDGG